MLEEKVLALEYLLGELFWLCRVHVAGIKPKKVKAEQKGNDNTNSAIAVVKQQLVYLSQGTDGLEL